MLPASSVHKVTRCEVEVLCVKRERRRKKLKEERRPIARLSVPEATVRFVMMAYVEGEARLSQQATIDGMSLRGDVQYAVNLLGRCASNPTQELMEAAH